MAKPTYSIGGLDFATAQKIEAYLNGGGVVAGAVVTAPPPPPTAAPPPPPTMAPPPPPTAAPPPPPTTVAAPPLPPPAGGITQEALIAKMAAKVGVPGNAEKVAGLMAQYNAKAPGVPGPIMNVDPAQYANLSAALDALP